MIGFMHELEVCNLNEVYTFTELIMSRCTHYLNASLTRSLKHILKLKVYVKFLQRTLFGFSNEGVS